MTLALIEMASPARLQAKTFGGRAVGYTALHFAASGSDCTHRSAHVCQVLIGKRLDVNARTPSGNTPLLLVAGTGVVDVAKVLVELRADISATANNGKNCMDKRLGTSGSMTACPHPSSSPRKFVQRSKYSEVLQY